MNIITDEKWRALDRDGLMAQVLVNPKFYRDGQFTDYEKVMALGQAMEEEELNYYAPTDRSEHRQYNAAIALLQQHPMWDVPGPTTKFVLALQSDGSFDPSEKEQLVHRVALEVAA